MRTAPSRFLPLPWMRYPATHQDEAARQAIELRDLYDPHPYVPEPFPPCSKCGTREIFCWRTEAPEKAVCTVCCDASGDGHEFVYERGEGLLCKHCGDRPSDEWYSDRAQD